MEECLPSTIGDVSLPLMDVSQSRYAERETARKVCYIIHCVLSL